MTKLKLTKRERQKIKEINEAPKIQEKPFTLKTAFSYLWSVIHWHLFEEKYLNKQVFYKGKWLKITGETRTEFFISEYPKHPFLKNGPYKVK